MRTRYPDLEHQLQLHFQPVVNDAPRYLTREQIAQYNELGYIEPVRVFEGEELARVQAHLLDSGRDFTALHPHTADAGVYDIVAFPRTVNLLRDLIGDDIVCHMSQFINKPPGQVKGGQHHQDATFNAMDAGCPIVWLAVQDADADNGCMWFVPGSHKLGVVECDDRHYVVDPLRYGAEIPCPVKAGHIVIMSDLLFHSSPANRSADRCRPGLTATYASAAVQPFAEAADEAVLVCGDDARGDWRTQPRPAGPALFR